MTPLNPMLAPARPFDLGTVDFSSATEFTRQALVPAILGNDSPVPAEQIMIIIADNEHRVIPKSTFDELFDPTATLGHYRAKEFIRAIPNPTGGFISVETNGSGIQYGGVNCWIVLSGNLRYLMEHGKFHATFKAV
jgi:hypothetical protein